MCLGLPRSLAECCLPLTNVLLIPELNGGSILNLVTFYMLLRQTEGAKGSEHLLKRVVANLVNSTVIAGLFGTPPDFHKFSRAITVTNALENPDQTVQFQGIISLKQRHLPLALLLADYLVSLRSEQAVEGVKATIAGAMTHVLCNVL
ncbi:uncharacterized protein BXIN_2166 [Babesia sp. Xinjiang]|uniref:uncharacterized protein n=1 Tax=Babesia sp. Xinjiang TaxID=462227 RepID=UPI000A248212|nr:uncharacterized protein BXIN_2166 [Babesia sp. Xinjiang]ORM40449.1 hypothetical protein BXIN_2166 [Babesia sp. Xinjiang]